MGMLLLSGCASAYYEPGSFSSFVGEHHGLGCIDLAVSRDTSINGPVIAYDFGNGCNDDVKVDFASVRAVGKTKSGIEVDMVAYDPRHELVPTVMLPRVTGRERIEYRSDQPVDSICVDIGGVDTSAPRRSLRVCP
jgi:hypothetical protein